MCKDQELGITVNWKMLRNKDSLKFSNDLRACENGTGRLQLQETTAIQNEASLFVT